MSKHLPYTQVKQIVLMMIYEILARDMQEFVTLNGLKVQFQGIASKAFMGHALQDLYQDDFIYFGTADEDDTDWRITRNGLLEAEALISHDQELYALVTSCLDENEESENLISSDFWAPLPIELSGKQYDHAIEASEAAYTEIKGSNGYAESEPQERDTVVWSLGEGLKQVKEGMPTRDQVISMLVKPFKYISEKFAGAAMGEVAKAAVKALLDWLG